MISTLVLEPYLHNSSMVFLRAPRLWFVVVVIELARPGNQLHLLMWAVGARRARGRRLIEVCDLARQRFKRYRHWPAMGNWAQFRRGRGGHRRRQPYSKGGHDPLAEKFFHFDYWSCQKSGLSGVRLPRPWEIDKWLGSPPLEPPRALPWKNSCLRPCSSV